MQKKTIHEIQDEYDLELRRIIKTIKKEKARKILLQFPDGLKPYAAVIADELERMLGKDKVDFFIWFGSCFGACDVPQVKEMDLVVQFSHSNWEYREESGIKVVK
jgi:2-(3-amino-3-carboxypropyl)histidine synthase